MAIFKEKITDRSAKEHSGIVGDVVRDTELSGFQFRGRTSGGAFYLRRFRRGKAHEIRIGLYPSMHAAEARAEALRMSAALDSHNCEDAPASVLSPTVEDCCRWYIGHVVNKTGASCRMKRLAVWNSRRICDLTHDEIVEFHKSLASVPRQANLIVKSLSSSINGLCREYGFKVDNPCHGIKYYEETPRKRFLTEEEAPRLLETLYSFSKDPIYSVQADAILMMLFTGQRKSNVLNMNLADIVDNVWTIPAVQAKSRRSIVVPLNQYALEILERRKSKAENGYCFHRKGKPLVNIWCSFKHFCQQANIHDLHIHDLRRTLGSWMLMKGSPIEVVSRMLGHSSIRITETVYAHLLPHKISDATNDAVAGMMSGKA